MAYHKEGRLNKNPSTILAWCQTRTNTGIMPYGLWREALELCAHEMPDEAVLCLSHNERVASD